MEAGRDLREDLAAGPAKSVVLGSLVAFGFYWVSTGCVQHYMGGRLLRWPRNIRGQVDLRHRVLDVGFLDRWWVSSRLMAECDVNCEEQREDGAPVEAGLRPMR